MAYATGEVVANPDNDDADGRPFMVVFKHGDEVIGSWPWHRRKRAKTKSSGCFAA